MKTTVISCADSFVYLATCEEMGKYFSVAIRMNMRTLKTNAYWWYKYNKKGKVFLPDSEEVECNILARMQESLIDTYEREFTFSSVKRMYEEVK